MICLADSWVITTIGGGGKRLLPFTGHRSKALVPLLNNYPLLEYLLFGIATQLGLRHFVMGVKGHHNYLDVQSYFQGGSGWSAKLRISPQVNFQYQNPNYQDRGSADGTLYNLRKFEIDRPVLVMPCDSLVHPTDLRMMFEFASNSKYGLIVGLAPRRDNGSYGVVELDEASGQITGFKEKPKKPTGKDVWVNTAFYLIKPWVFTRLAGDFGRHTLPDLCKSGELGGFPFAYPWYDFGSPVLHLESFLKVLDQPYDYITEHLAGSYWQVPGTDVCIRGRDYYAQNVGREIEKRIKRGDIKVAGRVLIGRDCWIGDNTYLANCSIGDLSTVGFQAKVVNSNVMDGWDIGSKTVIKDSVLGRGGIVGDYTKIIESFVGNDVQIGTKKVLRGVTIPSGGRIGN